MEALLLAEPVTIEMAIPTVPDPWTSVVTLVALTPGLLSNGAILDFIERVTRDHLPLIPVVEDVQTFRFEDVAALAPGISERNAAGLAHDGGAALMAAVRGHLGLESFVRDQKVFVSFRNRTRRPSGHAVGKSSR